ncbi:MAG: hypothetical protein JO328_21665 [Hyphomicrobiales bacterium]|nr:hypothetical protein [Hyphomicrobiales bacterium]
MSFSNLIFSDDPLILLGRLVLLCGLIFLVGRAGVDVVLTYATGRGGPTEPILRNPNYLSLAFGPTILLLLTWALKGADLYTYPALLTSLLAIVVLTALFNHRFRVFLNRPWTQLDGTVLAYIAAGFAFWMMLGINEHPSLRDSAIYLVQGFNLFFSRYAAEWPFYGVTFIPPFLLAEQGVSTTFALLSYGDHFAYFIYGVYFLNLLAAPAIPIGAYLLFRRFLGLWPALAAAGFFCAVILDKKIWSLRAESLAWIIGFAFLMALTDVFCAFKKDALAGPALRLFPLLTLLFFSLTLTHPATAFIVAIFCVAHAAAFVVDQWRRTLLFSVARLAGMSVVPLLLLLGAFAYTYSGTSFATEQGAQPPTGDLDAAIQFDNAWAGDPLDIGAPRVLESPPYMSRKMIAEITGLLPVAAMFRPGMAFIPLKQFPGGAIAKLASIPAFEKFAYVALLACAIGLYLSPLARLTCSRHRYLFWASVAVYSASILFSVYLDSTSVALFPLASIRRTFVYVACFYWLAVAIAVWDFLVNPLISFYASEAEKLPRFQGITCRFFSLPNSRTRWNRAATLVSVIFFVPAWFVYSITYYAPWPTDIAAFLMRTAHRVQGDFARRPDSQSGLEIAAARVKPIVEAMTFIRAHTLRGEWVFSNVSSSDNAFWFLTDGRYSLMEGAAIYQLYFLQKAAASRMHDFAVFARTADPELISPYGTRYVLLYKQAECMLPQCYGDRILSTDFAAFANSPVFSRVFENELYVVFEKAGAAQSATISRSVVER